MLMPTRIINNVDPVLLVSLKFTFFSLLLKLPKEITGGLRSEFIVCGSGSSCFLNADSDPDAYSDPDAAGKMKADPNQQPCCLKARLQDPPH